MPVVSFGNLQNTVALVTGASTGIGRAIALELASAGADVILHCRQSLDTLETVAREIRDAGRKTAQIPLDLARHEELEDFVARAWNAFGRVDTWVNNAGVDLLTGPGAQSNYSEKLEKLWNVDVAGTILLSRLAGLRMKEQGGGVILNIGWDQADRGMAGESGELFAASKNAVMGFTRSLAVSLAPEVRVNCIAPGWIQTAWGQQASEYWQQRVRDETPLGRWGTPEDIAAAARFLASPQASYITGQVINVNGGAVR